MSEKRRIRSRRSRRTRKDMGRRSRDERGSPRTMKLGKRIAERTEDSHTEVTGQTEYESFFSVSPVTSELMPFSVPPQSPFPVAMADHTGITVETGATGILDVDHDEVMSRFPCFLRCPRVDAFLRVLRRLRFLWPRRSRRSSATKVTKITKNTRQEMERPSPCSWWPLTLLRRFV